MDRPKTGPFGEGGSPAVCKVCGKVSEDVTMYEAFYSWYCSQACYDQDRKPKGITTATGFTFYDLR